MPTLTLLKPFNLLRWFSQRPKLANPFDTRIAGFLDLFLLAFLTILVIGNIITIGLSLWVDPVYANELPTIYRVALSVISIVLISFLRTLLKKGYLKTIARFLTIDIIANATGLTYLSGQFPDIAISYYAIALVIAASVLTWRETSVYASVSIICLVTLFTFAQMDLLPQTTKGYELFQTRQLPIVFTAFLFFLRLQVVSVKDLRNTLVALELQLVERHKLNSQLDYRALHDSLTDLPNRRLIENKIDLAIEASTQNPDNNFAVLFFDIDRFKDINDTLGHIVGDKVLIEFAKKLSSATQTTHFVGRLAGDEFIVLLNSIKDPQEAITIAKSVIDALEKPFLIENKVVSINSSIGIAYGNSKHTTSSEILHDADSAMYLSKVDGKGSYAIFDASIDEKIRTTLALEKDLPQAITNGEFLVYFHPIFKLDTLSLSGLEILTRWQHPTRGLINPDTYIPIAEKSGAIKALDLNILERACQQILRWKEIGLLAQDVYLSANLSPKCLEGTEFTQQVEALMTKLNFDPNCLTLEITEGTLMINIDNAIDSLKALKTIGINISIDDFGTGYSSLSYLHLLPIDTIKIDRFFVMTMFESTNNKHIVETIITLAKSLKMQVVAEGIEELEQLDHLKSLACDYGQGYYFTKPISIEDTEKFLKSSQDNSLFTHYKHFRSGLSP